MKMRKVFSLVLATVMLISLAACASSTGTTSTTAATQPTKNVKVVKWADTGTSAEFDQEITPGSVAVKRMGDKLEELSDGAMVLKIFPDGQLAGTNDEAISGLKSGAFEATCQASGNWSEYTDAFRFLNVPFLWKTADEAYYVLDGPIGQAAYEKVLKDTGIYVWGMMDIGFRHVTNNKKPIKSASDLKGLKIRTMTDDIQVACFTALGAAVTPLSYGELFTALQQGLVDAQENPFSNIIASRFYEVQHYVTITGHSYTFSAFAFSPVFVESLTEEERGWVKDAVIYGMQQGRIAAAEKEAGFRDKIAGLMEVYYPTDEELKTFVDGCRPAWDMVEKLMGSEAFNNLIDTVDEYRAKKVKS